MAENNKKLFSADDFDKELHIGDVLVFDKPELTKLRVDLTWFGTDLDICAFLLGDDECMHDRDDLVYFKSKRRWKTAKSFDAPDFNPLEGEVSTWPAQGYKNPQKWMDETLPISNDDAVIGSWDDMSDDGGDDECGETMHILLDEVDVTKHKSIVIAAVVAKAVIEKGGTFADAREPIVTIYNVENDELVGEYKLDNDFPGKDAVCLAKLVYDEDSFMWNFIPMADAHKGGMQYLATEVFN